MSDSELFREVDEAVREDRAKEIWGRWGSWILSAAVAIVAAVAINVWWQDRSQSIREADTAALITALVTGGEDAAETADALDQVAAEARPGVALLARLNAAGLAAEAGNTEDAASRYRAIAGDDSVDPVWRDFALTAAAWLELDGGDPAALAAELQPLTEEGNPWRFVARELMAWLALREGDRERARTLFQELADNGDAPEDLRARAGEMADALSVS